MKRFVLLLLALYGFSFYGTAQSLDKALERSEMIREQKGEQSQEYLAALDSVIQYASLSEELETALSYRKAHLNIIRQMKGEDCVEVADDLWRLGNISLSLKDANISHEYFIQAADIFEKTTEIYSDSLCGSHYRACLFSILASLERDEILRYSSRLEDINDYYLKDLTDYACPYLKTIFQIGSYNYGVGEFDNTFYYSKKLLENCASVDSCNFHVVNESYQFVRSFYYKTDQRKLLIQTARDYLDKLDATDEGFVDEKIEVLYNLLLIESSNVDEAIAYGKRAEKLLFDSNLSQNELYRDKRYLDVVSHIAYLLDVSGKYIEALPYRLLCCDILKYNGETDTERYYDELFEFVGCAFRAGEYSVAINTISELEPLIFKYSDNPTQDALTYTSFLARSSMQLGKFEDAIHYYDDIISMLPLCQNGEALIVEIVETLTSKAEIYNQLGRREDALLCLYDCKKRIENMSEDQALLAKVPIYQLEGQLVTNYEDAMAKFDSALFICNQLIEKEKLTLSSDSSNTVSLTNTLSTFYGIESIEAISNLDKYKHSYAITLLHKGMTQAEFGNITEAYGSFIEASVCFEQLVSKNNTYYLSCLVDIAYCEMKLANYSDAINTIDNTMHLIEDLYGIDNPYYAICLSNYALYYYSIGDYNSSLHFSKNANNVFKELYGDYSTQHLHSLVFLGHLYLDLNNPEEAYPVLLEALLHSKNNNISLSCDLNAALAITMLKLGRIKEGLDYYDKAEDLTKYYYGTESRQYAKLSFDLGKVMLDFEKGKKLSVGAFLNAAGIMYTNGYKNDPLYLSSLCWYGASGLVCGDTLVSDFIPATYKAIKDFYLNNLMFFTSNDRDVVWSSMLDLTKVIYSARNDSVYDCYLYDYLLFSKSLLVSTLDNFNKAVDATGKQNLINLNNNIHAVQGMIDNQIFYSLIANQSCDSLYKRKTSMERQLMAEMKALGYSVNESITYDDVRRIMKENEIAIEFVDFNHLKDEKTYYVALLAKSSWDNPVYVTLCTEDDLKSCIGNPNVTYSMDDLYRLLWQPLAEYINESDNVYFSLSGMLHTIALESLHTPDGSCLSDKYNLVRLTSTRELCKERQPKTYETGAVYGGLQYDVDQQRMTEVASMNKTVSDESPVFALRGEDRGNWNYLQGTKDEVEHIAGIMRQANIGCELFEGDLGNEESFKALSGSNTDIIHLATHGYFLEGEKADMNDFMQSLSPLARQKTDSVIDPLLRSGLILSGGNRAWLGHDVPEGIEDGVLTALEISTMNLSGTDMVVMSACETGLGDITSDGVFGLQRAFKMAGVQTLVMSLWKVDDNATSLMMQTFYEHLLSGMSKREAFNLAQAAVRAKYSEPYYWAGFVMLD